MKPSKRRSSPSKNKKTSSKTIKKIRKIKVNKNQSGTKPKIQATSQPTSPNPHQSVKLKYKAPQRRL